MFGAPLRRAEVEPVKDDVSLVEMESFWNAFAMQRAAAHVIRDALPK